MTKLPQKKNLIKIKQYPVASTPSLLLFISEDNSLQSGAFSPLQPLNIQTQVPEECVQILMLTRLEYNYIWPQEHF